MILGALSFLGVLGGKVFSTPTIFTTTAQSSRQDSFHLIGYESDMAAIPSIQIGENCKACENCRGDSVSRPINPTT